MSVVSNNIIHRDIEPGVINADMIIKSVLDNCPKGEIGRLIAQDGLVLEDIKELRLEFLNILRIDHLWMLDALVILHISNNMIEKIENLEQLVNLKELDLSFNNIEIIENLDNLVKLEVLTLFGNRLTKLQNLKNLKLLMIFSVGNNMLDGLDNVLYLRPFKNLRALNMCGNPVASRDNFREYVHAFLPQLVYYEYRMITPAEREVANVIFKDELKEILAEESLSRAEIIDVEEWKRQSEAFVEHFNSDRLFQLMFKDDSEGIALLKINEEAEDYFIDFKDKFMAHCTAVYNFGLARLDARKVEIDQYDECVSGAKALIMDKSRIMMNDFIEKKSEIFLEMRNLVMLMQPDLDEDDEGEDHYVEYSEKLRELATEFQEQSHELWQELMRMEMTLFEQIEEATSNFEVCLRELISQFIEGIQALFVKMRDEENAYFEQVSDNSTRFLNDLNLMEDAVSELDRDLRVIFSDRDALTGAVSGSHEIHLQVIDERQDSLTTKANNWANNLFDSLRKEEAKRNRRKIVEISHFMELQHEEYEEIIASSGLHIEEPDYHLADDEEGGSDKIHLDDDESLEGEEEEGEEEGEEGKPPPKGTWDEEKEKRKVKRLEQRRLEEEEGEEESEMEEQEEHKGEEGSDKNTAGEMNQRREQETDEEDDDGKEDEEKIREKEGGSEREGVEDSAGD